MGFNLVISIKLINNTFCSSIKDKAKLYTAMVNLERLKILQEFGKEREIRDAEQPQSSKSNEIPGGTLKFID